MPAVDETFTITPAPRALHRRQHGADRADVAHDVQLPELVPLLVGDLLERALVRDADVVHEHVDAAELGFGLAIEPLRLAGATRDRPRRAAPRRRRAPSSRRPVVTTRRAFGREQPGRLEADAAGRAGDDADGVAQAEIHGSLA